MIDVRIQWQVFDLANTKVKVRMAMAGLLIVRDINTPSQHTVEYIPTAGSGCLTGTGGEGEQRAQWHSRSRPRKRINAFPSSLRP